ncbi:TPA: hypothetical protein CPT85_00405 [Candidatus Gastranaerophilales bacterium HUM_21]|nr:MAG TPA: hypothetical protein CPT85_00405 [Candidatus Gastranaerophilales bacterium HUM_21]
MQKTNKAAYRETTEKEISTVLAIVKDSVNKLRDSGVNEDEVVKYAQQEMKSVNTILNSIEPYYKEKIEQEFTFDQTVLKYDPIKNEPVAADIYTCNNDDCDGMLIKTDRAKITVKKDLRTNKYKISTEYESDELDNIN